MERDARDLSDGLISHGHRPTLITSHPGAPRQTLENGLTVIRVPRPPQGLLLRAGFESYLTHVPMSYLALRTRGFDLAHALYPTDALAAAAWKRASGCPAVLTYLGIPAAPWLDAARLRRWILVRALHGCDAVVTISRHAADALRSSLGHEARVIPPGIDLTAFQRVAERLPQPTIVCTAAAEVPRKNVGLLIAAFERLRSRWPSASLVLVRPQHPGRATRAGVDLRAPGVRWIDPTEDPAVLARVYSQAWVAVLPATDEAFGKVLVEALACGTPVVGLADGGIPEIIDRPEIGCLIERSDAEALARALASVLELEADPALADRCRDRAAEFSLELHVERYLSLYRSLLGLRSAAEPATP